MATPNVPGEYVTGAFSLTSMLLGYILSRQKRAESHRQKLNEAFVKMLADSEHQGKSLDEVWECLDKLREQMAGMEGLIRGLGMYPDLFSRKEPK